MQSVSFIGLPSYAIAAGATTPDPGAVGNLAWSTTLSKVVFWNGTVWNEVGSAATGTKVSALTAVTSLTGAEQLPLNQSSTSKRATLAQTTALAGGAVMYTAAGSALGAAIADYFTSTLSLEANSTYEIEAHAYFLKTTAGTVIWTWAFSSAPIVATSRYEATPITGFTTTTITGAPLTAEATVEAATTVAHAASGSLTTAVRHSFMFRVRIRTNAATTLQLRCTESAGTVTPQQGSYMRATKIV